MNTSRSIFARACLAAGLFSVVGVSALAMADNRDRDGDRDHDGEPNQAQVRRGAQIVPPGVKLNLMSKDRTMVYLGSYIVNTSGCIDCHSHPSYAPGGDPYLGQPEVVNAPEYLSGGRQFGPFTAPNITPDYAGKPAGLTRAQFIATMRTGHNPNDPPGEILQVMPWTTFGKKTEQDLKAIYEYLRAIPSLPDNTHPGP